MDTWQGADGDFTPDSISFDSINNIYVAGTFSCSSIDFDPGPGEDIHTTSGKYNNFIMKFDSSGAYIGERAGMGLGMAIIPTLWHAQPILTIIYSSWPVGMGQWILTRIRERGY